MALATILTNTSSSSLVNQSGPGGDLRLALDYSGYSIVRMNDRLGINLCDLEWEYEFLTDASLRLWFEPVLGLLSKGYCGPVDEANEPIASPTPLQRVEDGSFVVECLAPPANLPGSRLQIWFVEVEPLEILQVPVPSPANPKLILKTKRSTPTGGSDAGMSEIRRRKGRP